MEGPGEQGNDGARFCGVGVRLDHGRVDGRWRERGGALYGPLFAAMVVKEGEEEAAFPTGRVRARHCRRTVGPDLRTLLPSHVDFVGEPDLTSAPNSPYP